MTPLQPSISAIAQTSLASIAVGLAAGFAVSTMARLKRRSGYELRYKVVLITGGARGLGFALAREFGSRGARLVLVSRTPSELERAKDLLQADGRDVLTLVCDVRDATQVSRTVATVIEHFGAIDVLVNNAGVIQVAPLEHTAVADYQQSLQTHFWGPLYFVRACLPHMRRQGGGRILNISSIGGRIAVPHLASYTVGKFALVGLSETLRAELQRERILVTTATPGLMRTGSHVRAQIRGQHEAEARWFGAGVATPVTSMRASRAARQIVNACVEGRAHATPGVQARLAEIGNALAPGLTAGIASLATRGVLPGASAAPAAHTRRVAGDVGFGWLTPLLAADTAGQPPPQAAEVASEIRGASARP